MSNTTDEWEEQEDDEDDGYYDALEHPFGDYCVRFELVCPPPQRVDELVQRFVN